MLKNIDVYLYERPFQKVTHLVLFMHSLVSQKQTLEYIGWFSRNIIQNNAQKYQCEDKVQFIPRVFVKNLAQMFTFCMTSYKICPEGHGQQNSKFICISPSRHSSKSCKNMVEISEICYTIIPQSIGIIMVGRFLFCGMLSLFTSSFFCLHDGYSTSLDQYWDIFFSSHPNQPKLP